MTDNVQKQMLALASAFAFNAHKYRSVDYLNEAHLLVVASLAPNAHTRRASRWIDAERTRLGVE